MAAKVASSIGASADTRFPGGGTGVAGRRCLVVSMAVVIWAFPPRGRDVGAKEQRRQDKAKPGEGRRRRWTETGAGGWVSKAIPRPRRRGTGRLPASRPRG